MEFQLRLSSLAEQDVSEVVTYLAKENLAAALRIADKFSETFELLARNPELGEVFEHPERSLRRFTVENYVVIYQNLPRELLVVRVFHGARQIEF